ncbi:MAG: hypothetical protein ACI82G_002687, partial [Bradymonadia bacterium]
APAGETTRAALSDYLFSRPDVETPAFIRKSVDHKK